MKKNILFSALALIALLASSCELVGGNTYDNDYAQEWYKASENTGTDTWDILKLDLSDQTFEASESTLDIDANLSEYEGTTKGSITELDSNSLIMTVEEIYFDAGWYSREDYINLQMDLGQSETEATALADNHFISTTIDYTVTTNPATLFISGINDFSGTYYSSVMASVING